MSHEREQALRADAAGRQAAQTRFVGTVVVEAGAGTGKTTTLVARILAWSLGQGWGEACAAHPDAPPQRVAEAVLGGVAAITFTEAGAAEMATRAAAALARLAGAEDEPLAGFDPALLELDSPDLVADRAHHLLGALDHLTVETIHAFCRRLLANHPLEAGLHPDLQVDPDLRLSEEIAYEVVDEAVRRAYKRPRGQALAELATAGFGPDRLVELLVSLRESGLEASALESDPFSAAGIRGIVSRLRSALETFVAAGGSDLRRVTSGNKAVAVAESVERTLAQLETAPADIAQLDTFVVELDRDWREHYAKLGSWRKGTFTKGEQAVLEPHGPAFAQATETLRALLRHFGRMRPRRLDSARRALAPLLAECEKRSAARGVVTFSDLLSGAYRLLTRRTDLRRRHQRRIRQLLVDEFQDTDSLQCEIVRLLALDGAPKKRPGLFLVGDPKQSIFGWREADLAAYENFVEAALAQGGERHSLVRNFRSDPPILDEVNAVVEPVMIQTPDLQPPFVGLEAHRSGASLDSAQWQPIEYWVSWGEEGAATRGEDVAELEAAAIARDVRAVHDETETPWSEMALLFRSTNRLDTYLSALRDAGVPFIVARDKQYYRRKEIIDAAALVRAVVDPLDHVALVTYLRSAVVGMPDAALIPLWKQDFPRLVSAVRGPNSKALAEVLELTRSIAKEVPQGVPGLERIAGWHHALGNGLETLARLRQSFRDDSAAEFIDLLRSKTLIEVTEAARYQGKFRLANLDRFFRRLEESMIERGNDMRAILRVLRRSVYEAPDAKEAPPKDSGEDAVQVLTIHKAKGLEFDHVYIPQMHTLHRHENDLKQFDHDRRWRGTDEPQYCLLHSATPYWFEITERARQVEATESVRLLYVALTRARQRVVLLGCWPEALEPRTATTARSPLDLVHARKGLTAQPADLARRAADEDRSWLDEEGIRWRFLGLEGGRARSRERREVPAWIPTAQAVEHQIEELATRQERAALRMARPRHAAASNESAGKLAVLAGRHEPRPDGLQPAVGRDVAMLVGTAVHRMFEEWELGAPAQEELARAESRVEARLRSWLPDAESPAALALANEILTRFGNGRLWERWLAIADHVVARELPMLGAAPPEGGALDFLAGAIDLIYRDPDDGRLVVADFKTDRVETEDAVTARATVYEAQEQVYTEAVQAALGLPEPPLAELWFLWPDRLWRTS